MYERKLKILDPDGLTVSTVTIRAEIKGAVTEVSTGIYDLYLRKWEGDGWSVKRQRTVKLCTRKE